MRTVDEIIKEENVIKDELNVIVKKNGVMSMAMKEYQDRISKLKVLYKEKKSINS